MKNTFKIFEFEDYDILARIFPGEQYTEVTFTIQGPMSIEVHGGRTFEKEPEALEFFNCLDDSQVWAETESMRVELKQKVREKYLEDRE